MPKPYTRAELDQGRCMVDHDGEPCPDDSERLFIHSACHTGEGNEVEYSHGVLKIRCRVCKEPIIDILVAQRTPPPPPPRRVTSRRQGRRR